MDPEVRNTILTIILQASQPLGWYGIATELGRQGIILDAPLPEVLQQLTKEGYLELNSVAGSHGSYRLTQKGTHFL